MGLEVASFIADLNASWPLATDERREGDDHLRLLKACLQAQFPNLGNSVAVTPTAAELNFVDGVTSAVQTQLDNGVQIEVGMQFVCRDDALPSNGFWSLVTSYSEAVPLVQNSLGLGGGGTWNHATGLSNGSTGQALGAHDHTFSDTVVTGPVSALAFSNPGAGSAVAGAHTHTVTVSGTTGSANLAHGHTGSTISSTSAWRPVHFNAVILQFDGP